MAAPEGERSLFLSVAHLVNEINALRKLVLWSYYFSSSGNTTEDSGQVSLTAMFLKLLAGKLNEGQELLRKTFYGTGISRDYLPFLTEEGQHALSDIKRYFKGRNAVHEVRKGFAFHYSPDEMNAVIPDISEELTLYIEDGGSANNLYYFAEVIANTAMLKSIKAVDLQDAFERFSGEVRQVAGWFTVACDSLMLEFLKRHSDGIWNGNAKEVDIDDLRPFEEVRIPWFSDTSRLREQAA